MRVLAVLCQNPFNHFDGGTYAVRASLSILREKADLSVTGFGADFEQQWIAGIRSLGSLGTVRNTKLGFLVALAFGRSYSMDKFAPRSAQRALRRIIQEHDISMIWFEKLQSSAAAMRLYEKNLLPAGALRVLRSHNIEHNVFSDRFSSADLISKALLSLEKSRLRREELKTIATLDRTLTISREDRDELVAMVPRWAERISFLPLPIHEMSANRDRGPHNTVLFVGDCRWRPNQLAAAWIANQLAPELESQIPGMIIRLVGNGTEAFRGYKNNLQCAGFVGDIDAEYRNALCTIAPIWHGGGVNAKVIDSLAHGIPVVGSKFGRRGTRTSAYLEAESPAEFCTHIHELSSNSGVFEMLSAAARQSSAESIRGFDAIWSSLESR